MNSIAAENLAFKFATRDGRTIAQCRSDYYGLCIDFAGDFESVFGGRLVYFETPDNPRWKYHCAVELDGLIHDLWIADPIPKEEFAMRISASSFEYTT